MEIRLNNGETKFETSFSHFMYAVLYIMQPVYKAILIRNWRLKLPESV
jgi:hypothetical protein